MVGIKPSRIPLLVEGDVARVKKYARVLITLDAQNRITVRENKTTPWLSVIAVVGSGVFDDRPFDEAVLCEVGIRRGRPYAAANKPRIEICPGEHRQITRRRKWFGLTDEQYLVVAPEIFRIIREITVERTSTWKRTTALVWMKTTSFSRRRKKMETHRGLFEIGLGIRFSVGYADRRLLADVLWAERSLSVFHARKISRVAGLLGLLMSRYRPTRRTEGNGFWGLKHVRVAKVVIAGLFSHEKARLVEELREKKRRPYLRYFLDHVLQAIGEPSPIFAESKKKTLANPGERIGQTYLRVVGENGRYLTIEVQRQPIEKPQPATPTWITLKKDEASFPLLPKPEVAVPF